MKYNKTRSARFLHYFYHLWPVLIALTSSGCVQVTSGQKNETISAVYIEHIGESNKSILPVVIFAKKPPETELKRMIGEVVWDKATMVSVSEDELRKIIAAVYKSFQTTQEDAREHKFGTFRVTIVEGKDEKKHILPAGKIEMARILPRDAMIRLLNAIEEVERNSASGNEELRTTIAELKGHLI